jgi:hypothetical protein
VTKYLSPEKIERRKKLQHRLTVGAATLGLATVGTKTGGATLKMLKKAPRATTALGHFTNVGATTAGAMGSVSALAYSDLRNTKVKKPHIRQTNTSAFGVNHS